MRSIVICVTFCLPQVLAAQAGDAEPQRASDKLFARCVSILKYGSSNQHLEPSKTDAVIALGLLGDERAVPVLIEYLQHDKDSQVRCEIVRALAWINTPKAGPALEKALKDDYEHVRASAAEALALGGEKRYAPAVEPLLNDKSKHVRSAAATSLGKLGAEGSVAALSGLLPREQDKNTRWCVVRALGAIGSPKAVPALERALEDAATFVRYEAAEQLERITGKTYEFKKADGSPDDK